MARELDLDLVEVAAKANPPVCRIMDYGKYKYEAAQKAKESRRKATNVFIKEMKYRPKIGEGDFDTKTRKVERFLREGHKVKVTIMFRGREMQHPELGRRILDDVAGGRRAPGEGRDLPPAGRSQHDHGPRTRQARPRPPASGPSARRRPRPAPRRRRARRRPAPLRRPSPLWRRPRSSRPVRRAERGPPSTTRRPAEPRPTAAATRNRTDSHAQDEDAPRRGQALQADRHRQDPAPPGQPQPHPREEALHPRPPPGRRRVAWSTADEARINRLLGRR